MTGDPRVSRSRLGVLLLSAMLALPTLAAPAAATPAGAEPSSSALRGAYQPVVKVFPEATTPGHLLSLSGVVHPRVARPYTVQRSVGTSWRWVAAGVSDAAGHFAELAAAPGQVGDVQYRVVTRHFRAGHREYPRKVSTIAAVAVDDAEPPEKWLPVGRQDSAYSADIGVPSYPAGSWSVAEGSTLPSGLVLAADGTLSGTLDGGPGTSSFTATFTDRYGVSVLAPYRIRVALAPTVVPRDPGFGHLLAYNDFRSRPDEPIIGTAADSGHVYDPYYGKYLPYVVSGAYRIDPAAAEWNGWAFATLQQEEAPSAVGGRFFFDHPGGSSAQEVVLATWRSDSTVAKASVQFITTPFSWGIAKVVQGYRIYQEKGRYASQFSQDGTVYEMSMHLDRATSTVTVYLPDGSVKSWTDPDFAAYWGTTFAMQIRRTTTSTGVSGDAGVTEMFSGS